MVFGLLRVGTGELFPEVGLPVAGSKGIEARVPSEGGKGDAENDLDWESLIVSVSLSWSCKIMVQMANRWLEEAAKDKSLTWIRFWGVRIALVPPLLFRKGSGSGRHDSEV